MDVCVSILKSFIRLRAAMSAGGFKIYPAACTVHIIIEGLSERQGAADLRAKQELLHCLIGRLKSVMFALSPTSTYSAISTISGLSPDSNL